MRDISQPLTEVRLPSFSEVRVGILLRHQSGTVVHRTAESPPASHGDTDQADQEAEEEQAAPEVVQAVVDDDLDAEQDEEDSDRGEEPALGQVGIGVVHVGGGQFDVLGVLVGHSTHGEAEDDGDEHRSDRAGGRRGVPDDEEQQHDAAPQRLVPVDAQAGVVLVLATDEVDAGAVAEGAGVGLTSHDGSLRGMEVHGCVAENAVRVVGI